MYYDKYIKLNYKDKNLANYFDFSKNRALISLLNRNELLSIINNYGYDIDSNEIDYSLKTKLLKNISDEFTGDKNIFKIEEISTKITFILNEKSRKTQTNELLKYKIMTLLITNDEVLSILNTDEEIKDERLYFIFNSLSKKLHLNFDYDKLNIDDIEKLNSLVRNYFEFATKNNYLINNCKIFNIANTNDTVFETVKKVRKKV